MKLEVVGGSFKFKNTDYILKDMNFSLEDSDILSILGPNGVGKTTLIMCLTGLLQWNKGGTYLDGKNISSINNKEFWSKLSYIPQKRNSTFSYSGLDMVLFGAKSSMSIFERPRACHIKKACQIMKMVGIYNLKDKKVGSNEWWRNPNAFNSKKSYERSKNNYFRWARKWSWL